jgi:hypothetical protein
MTVRAEDGVVAGMNGDMPEPTEDKVELAT